MCKNLYNVLALNVIVVAAIVLNAQAGIVESGRNFFQSSVADCAIVPQKPPLLFPLNFLHPNKSVANKIELRAALQDAVKSILTSQDPDIRRTVPEIIQHDGYPFEVHEVTTDDGYILNYYRIPYGAGNNGSSTSERRLPVLLHHGLITDSGNWIATAKNDNLAYILANAGYDVWLSNCRGTQSSRSHTNKFISKEQYWDFSFEEIGLHDLPAALDYILKKTGFKKLYYIGHSMGTTIVFSGCSLKPETCDKIQLFIALAPSSFMYRSTSPARLMVPSELLFQYASKNPSIKKLLNGPLLNDQLIKIMQTGIICNPFSAIICGTASFLYTGFDYIQTNFTVLPLWLARATNVASIKAYRHYTQNMLRDQFSRFDYGRKENCKRYKQTIPPQYNVGAIRTKTILMYGATDSFAVEEDILKLARMLNPANVVLHKMPLSDWNHMDYMTAKNTRQYVGIPVLEYLKQYPIEA